MGRPKSCTDISVPSKLNFLVFIKVELNYNIVTISAVQQSDSIIYIYIYIYVCVCVYVCVYIYIYIYTHILFNILFHRGLLQKIGCSFPVLYSGTLLFILSKYNILHLLTPNSQPVLLPAPPPW